MDFKNIDKKYRPIPFWSWNEKLNTKETARQIDLMDKAGLGGYFMHARGGLQTPYMGEEWFRNISVGIEEADKRSMQAWAYDENGWPSGFGDGCVNANGLEYQQKYLRMEAGEKTNDRTIICKDGYHFYYDVNPYYVDTLDKNVIKCFIKEVYDKYYNKFGNSFEGFFTDEPQISRNGIPWSFTLPAEYKKEYGEELLNHLEELFRPIGNYEDTRIKFWYLITKLFNENYIKQIFNWCNEHGLKLTGHMVLEDELGLQITSNGACMPHYRYFHMPGIDWLGRNIGDPLIALQVSSVAHQFGKKEILAEDFACCGHNTSFDELKKIAQWQMVRGITKFCPHLEGYSIRGLRKRDYPPAMYYQQPWWSEYKLFNDSISRVGMLLSEGKVKFNTLLIHNITSAWAEFNGDEENQAIAEYNNALVESIDILEKKHIPFHLGDEIIIEQHARVENGAVVIGTQKYTNIVLPKHKSLLPSTVRILNEFERAGGVITVSEKLEANDICNNDNLVYTIREFNDFNVHYFINESDEEFIAEITKGSKMLDLKTGEITPFYGVYKFHPYESLMVIEDDTTRLSRPFKKPLKELDISGEWKISKITENSLTVDVCDVYFNNELVSENENAADVIHLACERKEKLKIRCDYHFNINSIPEDISLVCETPEIFTIEANGVVVDKNDIGYFTDISFRKLEIKKYLIKGKNTLSFKTTFNPSEKLFSDIEKAKQFESEKNKLVYDTEIEPIYLVGNFSVVTDGAWRKLDKNAYRYVGDFKIDAPVLSVDANNIEQQGFPFFAGRMTLKKSFNISDISYVIRLTKKGVNAVKVTVNGVDVNTLIFSPYEWDLSQHLKKGDNEIEITLVNNLRNLLGPHHLPIGECLTVCPPHFIKNSCVWTGKNGTPWEKNYCFVELGFENVYTD